MKDNPTDLAYWKARELLAGYGSPPTDAGVRFEHDFDEELGMYWYGPSASVTQPTLKAASIVRVPTFAQFRALQQARRGSDE